MIIRDTAAGENFRAPRVNNMATGLAVLLCLAWAAVSVGTGRSQTAGDKSSSSLATVSVATKAPGREIPRDFVGLSLEISTAGQGQDAFAGANASGNALQAGEQIVYALGYPGAPNAGYFNLMKDLGPGILRLGGNSQDNTCWNSAHAPLPKACKGELKEEDLKLFSEAAEASGWRLMVGLNLKQNSPSMAVSEVTQGIAREIKPEQVFTLELGNEPEGFSGERPKPYTQEGNVKDFLGYIHALRANPVAKQYALAGPATCCAWRNARDLSIFADGVDAKRNLKWLTVHYYAASTCDTDNVSAEQLLSAERIRESNGELKPLVQVANAYGIPIALAETNSISCGGMPGVSNAFASALWGLDHMFTLAEDGFISVNFQTSYRPGGSSYNPVDVYGTETAPGRWKYRNVAEPLYYALYLFSHNASGAHLLPVSVEPLSTCYLCKGPDANVRAYAVSRCPSCAVKIIVINKDMKAGGLVRVRLDRKMGAGALLLLDAPNLGSLATDVHYGGQQFKSDGVIAAPMTNSVAPGEQGNYDFNLRNAAAAVLTIEP